MTQPTVCVELTPAGAKGTDYTPGQGDAVENLDVKVSSAP